MSEYFHQALIAVADSALPPIASKSSCAVLANEIRRLGVCLEGMRLVAAVVAIGRMKINLTTGEMDDFPWLACVERQRNWVAGRSALKAARKHLGLSIDTSTVRFPNASTSITHAAGYAVSVVSPERALQGLGIDFEAPRKTSASIDRFFLSDNERNWIEERPVHLRRDDRIRLWTVKEAVYKACPANQFLSLKRIQLKDPSSDLGAAVCKAAAQNPLMADTCARYASGWTPVGCVSLAVVGNRQYHSASTRRRPTCQVSAAVRGQKRAEPTGLVL